MNKIEYLLNHKRISRFIETERSRYLNFFKSNDSLVTGKIVSYFSKSKKHFEFEVKNGIKEGRETWWFKNTKIQMEVFFVKGKEEGFNNNTLQRYFFFDNSKKKIKNLINIVLRKFHL